MEFVSSIMISFLMSFVNEDVRTLKPLEKAIQAPHIRKVITKWPGLILQWEPVEGDDIIGYRMKVWELSKNVLTFENGETVLKIEPIEDHWSYDSTKFKPKWIIDVGPKEYDAVVNNVTRDIYYELRVQALTKNHEGPLSKPTTVAFGGSS